MTGSLPKKLKSDAILEALLEVRFEQDSGVVYEIVAGRLADVKEWRAYRTARLPAADIPEPIRRLDVNFRYQPTLEMTSPDGGISFRVGPQMIAYSRRGAYPGWNKFGSELKEIVSHFFRVIPNPNVSRLGLRYINALRSDIHQVNAVSDMGIDLLVGSQKVVSNLNLNFKANVGGDFETLCRIATIDFAEGMIPERTSLLVDVDVYTGSAPALKNCEAVQDWVEAAHKEEKAMFFKVLGSSATERLREH